MFDREWVSFLKVIPKKIGITMIKNDKNELIPTLLIWVEGLYGLYEIRCYHLEKKKIIFSFPSETRCCRG